MLHNPTRPHNCWPGRVVAIDSWTLCRLSQRYLADGHRRGFVCLVACLEYRRSTPWCDHGGRGYLCRSARLVRPTLGVGGFGLSDELLDQPAMSDKVLRVGLIGSAVATICCFTPALPLILGAVGLSAAVGYLDIVLLPTLTIFLLITGYALWKRRPR